MGIKLKLPKINKKNFPYKLVICYWEDIVSDASWLDINDIKKKTETLVQASMKLGEAIYKSEQSAKQESGADDDKDNKDKKDDNVVDADFEEVKEENKDKDKDQEKSA